MLKSSNRKIIILYIIIKNNNNKMAKECKCIKDYKVSCRDYSNGVHSEIYMKVIYKEGDRCYYTNKGDMYYVAPSEKHIRNMQRYSTYIEELSYTDFNEYFSHNSKPIKNTEAKVNSSDLSQYNELAEKLVESATGLFNNGLTNQERIRFKTLEKKLGFGENAGFFIDQEFTPKNNKRK